MSFNVRSVRSEKKKERLILSEQKRKLNLMIDSKDEEKFKFLETLLFNIVKQHDISIWDINETQIIRKHL